MTELARGLEAVTPPINRMRRNIGHMVQDNPVPYRRAAADALAANAAEAAAMADHLAACPRPSSAADRLVLDQRAVQLGRRVDRIRRLWSERAGRPPLAELDAVIDALRGVVRKVRRKP